MNNVVVNGFHIETRGAGGGLYVNGRLYGPVDGGPPEPTPLDREITLDRDGRIEGDVQDNLTVHGAGKVTLVVHGAIHGNVRSGGDVRCTSVVGDVSARGTGHVDTVIGSILM